MRLIKRKNRQLKELEKGDLFYFDDYVKTKNGYFTCVHLNEYPTRNLDDFFLLDIKEMIVIDLLPLKKDIVKNAIDKAYNSSDNVAIFLPRLSSNREAQTNQDILDEIKDTLEFSSLLQVHVRFFLYAKTKNELFNKVSVLEKKLGKFKLSIYSNQLKEDIHNLLKPLSKQKNQYNKEIFSNTLSKMYHVNGIALNDPEGFYLGESITGDPVIFDPTYIDSFRKNYNFLYFGLMNSGKSTLQKKVANMVYLKKGKIRIFDSSGEFSLFCKYYGGVNYKLTGEDGIINPLEIIRYSTPEESFSKNISKLTNMYAAISQTATETEVNRFATLLFDFYVTYGITEQNNTTVKKWPIFSDFLQYLKNYQTTIDRSIISEQHYSYIENMITNIETLVRVYGSIFNGESTFQIKDTQLIVFDISNLKSLPDNIFSALMYSVNNILFSEMLENNFFDTINTEDVPLYFVNIDEAHRILNQNTSEKTKDFYYSFLREARKYKASMCFSFHRVTDLKEVKPIFDLCQYKFIFQQDPNVVDELDVMFKNVFSDTDLDMIPYLAKGKCILSITGYRNIPMYISLGSEIEQSVIATGGK